MENLFKASLKAEYDSESFLLKSFICFNSRLLVVTCNLFYCFKYIFMENLN